ncbi:MAG TPA: hypothetical protein VGG64_23925 [Pirellulales bacterium]|jgi:hypothetical protein
MDTALHDRFIHLDRLLTENYLLPIEELRDTLSLPFLAPLSLAMLAHWTLRDGTLGILPSLCLTKLPEQTTTNIATVPMLYRSLQLPGSPPSVALSQRLTDISSYLRSHGFVEFTFPDITILSKHHDSTHVSAFGPLAERCRRFNDRSLNKANASRDVLRRADKHADRGVKYDRRTDTTASNLLTYVCTRFDLRGWLLERQFGASQTPSHYRRRNTYLPWTVLPGQHHCPTDFVALADDHITAENTNPFLTIHNGQHVLLYPFVGDLTGDLARFLLLITGSTYLRPELVRTLLRHSAHYFSAYKQRGLLEAISDLDSLAHTVSRRESLGALLNAPMTLTTRVRSIANVILNVIVHTSNAYTGTCRIFNPMTRSLDLVASVTLHGADQPAQSIHLSSAKSWNVTAFKGPDRFVYIPNVDKYRRELSKDTHSSLGDVDYRIYRRDTQSQMCFPLFYKGTRIGVLNLESPIPNAFRQQGKDLLRFVRTLQNYVAAQQDSADRAWLATRTEEYQGWHEIRGIIHSPTFPQAFRDLLDPLLTQTMAHSVSTTLVPLSHLRRFLDNYIREYRATLMQTGLGGIAATVADSFAQNISLNGHRDKLRIESYKLDWICVICKHLLDNCRKHSNPLRDYFRVELRKGGPDAAGRARSIFGNGPRVEIIVWQHSLLDDAILQSLFYRPITDDEGRTSFGLFIVGMLAREMGGSAFAGNIPDQSASRIVVTIPCDLASDDESVSRGTIERRRDLGMIPKIDE